MGRITQYAARIMPEEMPLKMTAQRFDHAPQPRQLERIKEWVDHAWRLAAFAPSVVITVSLIFGLLDWIGAGSVSVTEMAIIVLAGGTLVWISLPVSTTLISLTRRMLMRRLGVRRVQAGRGERIAILVPVYNETTSEVFGNIRAMLRDLQKRSDPNSYDVFVLSDTNDPETAAHEENAIASLRSQGGLCNALYYRRRTENVDKKVGNISDWITRWGGGYEAMLVLDSDSLMSGAAIRNLARLLQNDPDAGLIQSFPVVIGAETLFGRIQQFSNTIYGWLLAEGLALWSQREGNYWGHNAIIRIRAFAQSAHLPHLNGRGGRKELVLSHDFVEAGLLRRAGWAVRFEPLAGGSYEETPQTLVDYALRDRRWCQGNLQHLRLLNARGFHPVTRFHLLQGAVAFLLSPAWLMLIVMWSAAGLMRPEDALYFNAANPLYPIWPEMARIEGEIFLIFIYVMLLLPKLLSIAALSTRSQIRRCYGGLHLFLGAAMFEIICSIIYAPILMVQQSIAVFMAIMGRSKRWLPQARRVSRYGWASLLRFHWLENVIGLSMLVGIGTGVISLWLAPIAGSLVLAVPLSWFSAVRVCDLPFAPLRLDTPLTLREPRIIARARQERAYMRAHLDAAQAMAPAE